MLPFKFFPIDKKKIVFSNYAGLGYGCNPKYIAEKLLKMKTNYKLVWLVNKNEYDFKFPDGIKVINNKSWRAFYELSTAKIWVDNYHKVGYIEKFLNKRNGQYYIQTWHGSFGIKKIEGDVNAFITNKTWYNNSLKNAEMQNYLISNSIFENHVYKSAFWNKGKILQFGHARNDIFFGGTSQVKKKVYDRYNIKSDNKVLIYVPTYRQGFAVNKYDIDYDGLKNTLETKFGGEWIIMVRLHRNILSRIDFKNRDFIIDATEYDDVQELLASADAAITDYSSCIFDFMLTKRPAFIYANDIKKYNNERGFYYSLYETPFPIAESNVQLMQNIKQFDEMQYKIAVEKFLKEKGSVEDGRASERAVELIQGLMDD